MNSMRNWNEELEWGTGGNGHPQLHVHAMPVPTASLSMSSCLSWQMVLLIQLLCFARWHAKRSEFLRESNGLTSVPRQPTCTWRCSRSFLPCCLPCVLPSFLPSFLPFLFWGFWVFRDRVSLCIPGCPETHFVDQAGLELRNPPASASQVLGLKAFATTVRLKFKMFLKMLFKNKSFSAGCGGTRL